MKALFEVVILPVSDPDGNAWVMQERNHRST